MSTLKRSSFIRNPLGFVLILLFLFPFFALGLQITAWSFPSSDEFWPVFVFTFWQALLSAALSLIVGCLSATGLMWLSRVTKPKIAQVAESFVLLPNAAPVILLLLAVLKIFPAARGLTGIVFVHTLLNAGLVAIAFLTIARTKLTGMAELAWVEGASRLKFLMRGVLPLLKKDLALLFLFVFALCFSSFAVPLLIGGSRATTLEVLIYQKVRIGSNWSEALGLAAIQMFTVLALAWFMRRGQDSTLAVRTAPIPLLSAKWTLPLALLPSLVLIYGMVDGLAEGFEQLRRLEPLMNDLPRLALNSLGLGFLVATFVITILLIFAYLNPRGWQRRFFMGYAAPSSVLTGIALLLAWRTLGWATYVKIALALTLVSVPSFYRLQWDGLLRSIDKQRVIAMTLGASHTLTFMRIVLPQVIAPACFLGGIASLWAWGDFALSSVIAERSITVAMATEGLMGSYRLEAATVLSWILVVGGVFSFLFITGVGLVLGEKSQT